MFILFLPPPRRPRQPDFSALAPPLTHGISPATGSSTRTSSALYTGHKATNTTGTSFGNDTSSPGVCLSLAA
ncbi:hypothetical protein C8Q77DRAFT_572839 [Trametes polyzona]|nr:hypothetical protein C8Q77DRAFT_572839 [Trametes polyzona]